MLPLPGHSTLPAWFAVTVIRTTFPIFPMEVRCLKP